MDDSKTKQSRALRFWRWLKENGRVIPLIGPLFMCTAKNHLDSLKEFFISVGFGTATFTVTAVFLQALTSNSKQSYWGLLWKTVESGQLFIFAVGMLGPILLSSAEDPDRYKIFPSRTIHITILVVIAIFASGFYAFVLIGRTKDALDLIDMDFLLRMSVLMASLVVIMRYLTIVYRRNTADFLPERDMPKQTLDFAGDFAKRHGDDV